MNRVLFRVTAGLAAVCFALCLLPAAAMAKPCLLSPAAGAQVPYGSQSFSWTDNYAEGSLDHWYMEISTRPETDYYYFGFFQTPPAYTSGDTRVVVGQSQSAGSARLRPGPTTGTSSGFYGGTA